MRKWRPSRYVHLLLSAVFVAVCGGTGTAFALTSSSTHYQVTETQFSAGSTGQSCSATYCAQASLGDTTTPQASTAAFGTTGGTEPLLEVIVDSGQSDLGVLSPEKTSTKTMSVSVRNYLSGGYILQIVGDSPKFGSHYLATSTTPSLSVPGTEQFALNAVANTSPAIGAAALQTPADQVAFGTPYPDYNTPNLFKYVSGDNIAHSLTESGQTDYTISMVVNVSSATPAGHYSADFAAIVIPVY